MWSSGVEHHGHVHRRAEGDGHNNMRPKIAEFTLALPFVVGFKTSLTAKAIAVCLLLEAFVSRDVILFYHLPLTNTHYFNRFIGIFGTPYWALAIRCTHEITLVSMSASLVVCSCCNRLVVANTLSMN